MRGEWFATEATDEEKKQLMKGGLKSHTGN